MNSNKSIQANYVAAPANRADAVVDNIHSTVEYGEDVYNANADQQILTQKRKADAKNYKIKFLVEVQNDGTSSDQFSLDGCAGGTGFKVTYAEFTSLPGVTTANVTNGSYQSPSIPAGDDNSLLLVTVIKGAHTHKGSKFTCLLTSTSAVSTSDTAGMKVVLT